MSRADAKHAALWVVLSGLAVGGYLDVRGANPVVSISLGVAAAVISGAYCAATPRRRLRGGPRRFWIGLWYYALAYQVFYESDTATQNEIALYAIGVGIAAGYIAGNE